MKPTLLLAGAIASEVTATLCLKGALGTPWLYAIVVVGYIASFTLLALTLRAGLPIGVAYGIWGAIGVGATALLSAVVFGEPLTPLMTVGMVLVIGGVLAVELGSGRHRRPSTGTSTETGG